MIYNILKILLIKVLHFIIVKKLNYLFENFYASERSILKTQCLFKLIIVFRILLNFKII